MANQVTLLEKNPAKSVKELQQGRTQTVKQLIESANALSPDSTIGQVPIMLLMVEQDQPAPALDVQSSVSQTTIGSVPEQGLEQSPTLDDKPQ